MVTHRPASCLPQGPRLHFRQGVWAAILTLRYQCPQAIIWKYKLLFRQLDEGVYQAWDGGPERQNTGTQVPLEPDESPHHPSPTRRPPSTLPLSVKLAPFEAGQGPYRLGVKSPRCGRGAVGSIPATDIVLLPTSFPGHYPLFFILSFYPW
ncbi:hypothetical protein FA13DRAFT_556061 [Coprinellus micaceus]|uniref:Uncharacterized protein n=1 Tax=Coprinellus micaceus TaxID=71717 RepID=A0A4Y7SBK3_COPMI|nr:hypothetical protein FA13DRAFT_556061 [Coprinellus micaceus]